MSATMTRTLTLDLGELGEHDVAFAFTYQSGTPETGRMGLPENYDPGSESEIDISSAMLAGFDIWPLFNDKAEIANQLTDAIEDEEPELDSPEVERWAA